MKPFLNKFSEENEYPNGCAYKTHAFPPESLPENVKVIYMFGNPYDIVVSAHKKMNHWGSTHHFHLESDKYTPNDCVFKEDTMMLYEHFDAWLRPQSFPLITIRYETLFKEETRQTISRFLGFNFKLPAFKERQANWSSHPRKEEFSEIYSDLALKIDAADDVRIWE